METPVVRQFSAEVEVTYHRRITFSVAADAELWKTAWLTAIELASTSNGVGAEVTHLEVGGILPLDG